MLLNIWKILFNVISLLIQIVMLRVLIYRLCDLKIFCCSIYFPIFYFQGCWLTKAHTSYNIKSQSIDAILLEDYKWVMFIHLLSVQFLLHINRCFWLKTYIYKSIKKRTLTRSELHDIKCGGVEMFLLYEWSGNNKKEKSNINQRKNKTSWCLHNTKEDNGGGVSVQEKCKK